MFTNADCTIFNKYVDKKSHCDVWTRTVIKGVYWESGTGGTLGSGGFRDGANLLLIVPCNADTDGKNLST